MLSLLIKDLLKDIGSPKKYYTARSSFLHSEKRFQGVLKFQSRNNWYKEYH